jgi:hypothetical protein
MKHKLFSLLALSFLSPALAAGSIDMDDPRRALGRENDIRIDAQLLSESVSSNGPIGVTWQIENLGQTAVAVSPKEASASYDADTGVITVAIGSEVPGDGRMPDVELIQPGQKKVFRSGASARINPGAIRTRLAAAPRSVQVKVTILRDLEPFLPLIRTGSNAPLSDELFDRWFEATDTILLNTIPVHYAPSRPFGGAEGRTAAGGF